MRDAQSGPSSAFCPASAKSATHSFSRAGKSGRHKNFPVSLQFSAEMPRLLSIPSRAPRLTSQHTANASSGLTLMAPRSGGFRTTRSAQPPWDFLLSASKNSLQSFALSRLAYAANLRKQIAIMIDQWIEENTAAMLARWLLDQATRRPLSGGPFRWRARQQWRAWCVR